MEKIDDRRYKADEGCLIVRVADGYVMGDMIDLGSADSIDNYADRQVSEEEIREFNKKYREEEYEKDI